MKQYKIALISRSTLYKANGGDTVQVVKTAQQLKVLGVSVDIKLANEMIDYDRYDLLHFFNITRPADILCHIMRSSKPFVVSTIFVDYSMYDKLHRKGLTGKIFSLFSQSMNEYFKTIYRWIRGTDILSSYAYLYTGQYKAIRKIISKANYLLPNSINESNRLREKFNFSSPVQVICNGVDKNLFHEKFYCEKNKYLVLHVARIEGIKNQLNLIRALNNTEFTLVVVGAASLNQGAYYKNCREIASRNIFFIEQISQSELVRFYAEAKVHVLPSWFETTGLSSLEAAAMGCNIVITDYGDAKEYLGNEAFYCDPSSPESIYDAVKKASEAPISESLSEKIIKHYNWHETSKQTLEVYKKILGE